MEAIEGMCNRLEAAGVEGELWVDGSFTEKIDPADVDLVLRVSGLFYDGASDTQRATVDWVGHALKRKLGCDAYRFMEWPEGHPFHPNGLERQEYWRHLFTHGRDGSEKGLVVLKLLEGFR